MTKPNANSVDSGAANCSKPLGRRRFLAAAGTGAIAASFAGCIGDDGITGNGDGDGPIKIGLLAPLPDKIALGKAYANAGQIIEKRLNDTDGLLGADVEVIIKDSEFEVSATRDKYRELVLRDEVDATFGLLNTEGLQAILSDISDQGKVHVTSGTGYTGLNDVIRNDYEANRYVFRTHQNGYIQGYNLMNYFDTYAEDLGISDVGIMLEDIEGYKPHAEAVKEHLPDSISIEYDETFSAGTEDYRPLLQGANQADVDMVIAFVSATGPTLINQWSRIQPNFTLGGFSINATQPQFMQNNSGAEYMMSAVPGCITNYTPTDLTEQFIQEHRDMFDSVPPYYTAYTTHDALWSWVEAVRETGSIASDDVIPAMEELSTPGVQGQMEYYGTDEQFEDTNQNFAHDLKFGPEKVNPPNFQWQNVDGKGEQVVLWPEGARQGEFQWPPWVDR